MNTPFNETPLNKRHNLKERQNLKNAITTWNLDSLHIDKNTYYEAIIKTFELGYSYDSILQELLDQINNHNDQLFINIKYRSNNNNQKPNLLNNLKKDLPKYGHKLNLSETSMKQLKSMETTLGLTTVGAFINFIDSQIIKHQKIEIQLPQTTQFQQRWNIIQNTQVIANYPYKLQTGEMRLIDYEQQR